jgi:hypothetical protein
VLIIERHCLQYSFPGVLSFSGEGWAAIEITRPSTDVTQNIQQNIDFYKVLILFRSIVEALIPTLVLLLAFEKITIISVVYVGSLFLCPVQSLLQTQKFSLLSLF